MTLTVLLPREPSAVPGARHRALRWLGEQRLDRVGDDLALVVSELVSNAVRHTGVAPDPQAPVRMSLDIVDHRLRVEVHDPGRMTDLQVKEPGEDVGGRGLFLVETLSKSWGVQAEQTGKCVWAELALD